MANIFLPTLICLMLNQFLFASPYSLHQSNILQEQEDLFENNLLKNEEDIIVANIKLLNEREMSLRSNKYDIRPQVVYNESLARMALDFSSAAYAKNPRHCIRKYAGKLKMHWRSPCDIVNDRCWGFIAVQAYFYTALKTLWSNSSTELRKLVLEHPNKKLLFTGHSLGGAISSIASSLFVYENADLFPNGTINSVYLINFGSPRVGNFEYATTHDNLIPNSWRLIHKYDLVPHLPACYEFHYHRSCIPAGNHSPYHHGIEVWYNETMKANSTYTICQGTPFNEDDLCSNKFFTHYNVFDHLVYFEKDVSLNGEMGCV